MAGQHAPTRSVGEAEDRVRLDKWLWAARFFKTRQLAAEAITGGKVHLNGQRTKPGKEIGIGARLEISKEQTVWEIIVTAVTTQRRPAREAVQMYRETPESLERREADAIRRREHRELGVAPERRPSKKDRRLIRQFKTTLD
ncbi:MAG TPA: S4 domain-containing protein [Methylococcus sp.]|nr:S4 domain-containing protein [Methylococcus sp.]